MAELRQMKQTRCQATMGSSRHVVVFATCRVAIQATPCHPASLAFNLVMSSDVTGRAVRDERQKRRDLHCIAHELFAAC